MNTHRVVREDFVLRDFVSTGNGRALAVAASAQLRHVHDCGRRLRIVDLQDVVAAKILSVKRHPEADRLGLKEGDALTVMVDAASEKLSQKAGLEVYVESIDLDEYPVIVAKMNIEKKAELTLTGFLTKNSVINFVPTIPPSLFKKFSS